NFYLKSTDAKTQDILTCVKDGALVQQPAKYVGKRGREYRYGLPNEEFYFKSPREMKELFADQPLSIENTIRIANQVEEYELKRDVLLPKFDIPETFQDEDEFLRHLTYEGAAKRYEEITDEIRARIDFELETIAKTGYPGYFLIVQDVTTKARELGTWVGPGRGSAAGSAVAYCIGITNVDPIKYDLLFERFLNPDRISLPDIDIDFDDEGRDKVIQYVIDKYGASQVAQIITYGTMGGKSAIRDTARVLDLPLDEAGRLAKLIPNSPPSTTLAKIIGKSEAELKKKFRSDDIPGLIELQNITKEDSPRGEVLRQAFNAEGAVRNTGVHACGVIIAPEDITNLVPVANAKDSQLRVTQFDNNVVESAGLLKMDFLGLKTLTIMKDAIQMIRERHGRDINPDEIPLDDETTFSLFQDGSTLGIFQFESPGMRKYLKELKPTRLEDLIAMNALYRPGPMEYIPDFIDRKHGRSAIQYDLDAMEEFLEETYGITVYQEQVMLLSQKLGNFTKGMADSLRKGMGKKKKEIIDELKPVFFEGCEANGHDLKIVEKIWNDWEAFASYAFNKSHSTCYAYIAYQTGYLKANYPAEFMASVLTHNMSSIEKITFFIEECRQLGIDVLSPDVNESHRGFSVNKNGQIRFGLAGIKGVGEKAIEELIICRDEHGYFEDVFDLCKKVNLRAVNKKTMENLCSAGAFDCFETSHRAQYFATPENESMTGLEKAIKYGADFKDNLNATQHSLFGEKQLSELTTPILPEAEKYDLRDKLKEEKKLIGFYLSAHPLDPYKLEVQSFTSCGVGSVGEKPGVFKVAGIISEIAIRTSKNGKEFAFFNIEDFDGVLKIGLFGEDFLKFKHFLVDGFQLFLKLEVKPRPYNANELETKVRSIELLADIRQKLTKRLSLTLPLENVDDDFIQKIQELVEENQGKYPLKVVVLDQSTKFQISLNGANCKVDINDKLIKKLETFRGVNYKLN
ncbi:MAG: DNA polymerase-3 subunit alpha, partial [Sphingobacteriales bacterium]